MNAEMDKQRLKILLREADDRLFLKRGKHTYDEHLNFTADYLAKNYNRKARENGNRKTTPIARHQGKRQNSTSGEKTEKGAHLL